ncbi:MAG: hypothetical protein C3F07_08750 [Anaerolineales bacterium]|nr:MAG: hypothetical protein C3F07_08750 [Anaerolineales bacterium]
MTEKTIFVGDTAQQPPAQHVKGEFISLLGDTFYKIENYDGMAPFFMSLVSSSNHWLFISSTGGLTAGRVNAEQALFPYYTDDKVTENYENTGSKSILLVTRGGRTNLWEPFSDRYKGSYRIERNLHKNIPGTALVFEERNLSLDLTFRYAWRTSDQFGFVRSAWLTNTADTPCHVEFVDGIQNLLPANITSNTQNIFSPLLDAYKRSELDLETGLAIFTLNSTLTDLAEPSESLLGTTVFQLGLDKADYLISSLQLDNFRNGLGITTETEIRGRRGAYFIHAEAELASGEEKAWHVVADVGQDGCAVVALKNRLNGNRPELVKALEQDIHLNDLHLEKIVASADGLQVSNDALCTAHHFANVMFNVMRGGIFSDGYNLRTQDFIDFVGVRNQDVLTNHAAFFSELPAEMNILDLYARAEASRQADLIRLSYGYLPLTFSRRHGDPSRPWNRFSIDIKKVDGSSKLGYEGNWRDIFQNWEALAYSYPEYVEGMIAAFLNATTFDGYNPYRITREGIDWEIPEPNSPWSNIGYWSDHQIIYLQKLMEFSVKVHPGKLKDLLARPIFSYADVPYRIKRYSHLLKNPYNTIDFNWDLQHAIEARVKEHGTDGKLVRARDGQIFHASLTEKLLSLLLAKLVNFVPEGGIWMNTQRPEWNDANNALVGRGLSVVTLCYLRRMIVFCKELLQQSEIESVQVSAEIQKLFTQIFDTLNHFSPLLAGSFTDEQRRAVMDGLGQAGSEYRWNFYSQGLSGEHAELKMTEVMAFLELTRQFVEHSLRANRRSDDLYHAYNILHLGDRTASVGHLYEMLEGQVAILSSGMLTGEESLALLESLRNSKLYITDQHSYILYPDRDLPGFIAKNTVTPEQVTGLGLVAELVRANDRSLILQDEGGNYHFAGGLRNIKDVTRALQDLPSQYEELVKQDAQKFKDLFEEVFRHSEFTGRSGTFFAYEGLGSIYWHMVSKLLLAVQETIFRTRNESSTKALIARYIDIRKGLSFNKSPEVYGAFPTDPYSHTPKAQGAKQPGMTGTVKEEILTRQMELGLTLENGCLVFDPLFFDQAEVCSSPATFNYVSKATGDRQTIKLATGSVAFTLCQTPILIQPGEHFEIRVDYMDDSSQIIRSARLDETNSRLIFQRDDAIRQLNVTIMC